MWEDLLSSSPMVNVRLLDGDANNEGCCTVVEAVVCGRGRGGGCCLGESRLLFVGVGGEYIGKETR